MRGTSIRILLPRKETFWLEATPANIQWLIKELIADTKRKPLEDHGAEAEPLDDVNANLDCQDPLDPDGQNAQAGPLDDVVGPLGDDHDAHTSTPFERDAGAHEHLGSLTPLDVDAPPADNRAKPLAFIPTPNRKRDLEARASDAEHVEGEPRAPSASTDTLDDDETILRKQCLQELEAAMPIPGRVCWLPSRTSFRLNLGPSKTEFKVRSLVKLRKRNCFEEAYLDAKRQALEFLATC